MANLKNIFDAIPKSKFEELKKKAESSSEPAAQQLKLYIAAYESYQKDPRRINRILLVDMGSINYKKLAGVDVDVENIYQIFKDIELRKKILLEASILSRKALPVKEDGIDIDDEELAENDRKFDNLIKQCNNILEPTLRQDVINEIESLKANLSIQRGVDLRVMPTAVPTKPGAQLTIGDLHGNSLKFIFFLIKQGVLTLDKNEEKARAKYKDLVYLYNKEPLDEKDIEDFNSIIESRDLIWNPQSSIRLIGDEVGDRGKNDYFTLKILEQLNKNSVPTEILFSNHGIEFLEHYENGFKEAGKLRDGRQTKSVYKTDDLLKRKKVPKEELDRLVSNYYLPNLKLISYTINESVTPPHISLQMHAPVGIKTIKSLAKKFKIECVDGVWDKDVYAFAKTIDTINERFYERAKTKGQVTKMLKEEGFDKINTNEGLASPDIKKQPLVRLTWTRRAGDLMEVNEKGEPASFFEKLLGGKTKIVDKDKREPSRNGFTIGWGQGHDGGGYVPEDERAYVRNLDNNLGKDTSYDPEGSSNVVNDYFIHCSYETDARQLKKREELMAALAKGEVKEIKGDDLKEKEKPKTEPKRRAKFRRANPTKKAAEPILPELSGKEKKGTVKAPDSVDASKPEKPPGTTIEGAPLAPQKVVPIVAAVPKVAAPEAAATAAAPKSAAAPKAAASVAVVSSPPPTEIRPRSEPTGLEEFIDKKHTFEDGPFKGLLKIADEKEMAKILEDIKKLSDRCKKKGKGMKIKRYYDRKGKKREDTKFNDLEKRLQLKFSILIDDEGKARILYEGEEKEGKEIKGKGKLLGSGAFGKVKISQDLDQGIDGKLKAGKLKVVKISHKITDNTKEEAAMTKKAKVLVGQHQRTDKEKLYQFQEYGGKEIFELFNARKENGELLIGFEERIEIAMKIFEQMKIMHDTYGIIHRDIKSENILYNPITKQVMIIDYGFAMEVKEGNSKDYITDGRLCGTPLALAPEIRAKDGPKYSQATDVYAAGTVLMDLFGYLSGDFPKDQEQEELRGLPYQAAKGEQGYFQNEKLTDLATDEDDEIAKEKEDALNKILAITRKITTENTKRSITTDEDARKQISDIKEALDKKIKEIIQRKLPAHVNDIRLAKIKELTSYVNTGKKNYDEIKAKIDALDKQVVALGKDKFSEADLAIIESYRKYNQTLEKFIKLTEDTIESLTALKVDKNSTLPIEGWEKAFAQLNEEYSKLSAPMEELSSITPKKKEDAVVSPDKVELKTTGDSATSPGKAATAAMTHLPPGAPVLITLEQAIQKNNLAQIKDVINNIRHISDWEYNLEASNDIIKAYNLIKDDTDPLIKKELLAIYNDLLKKYEYDISVFEYEREKNALVKYDGNRTLLDTKEPKEAPAIAKNALERLNRYDKICQDARGMAARELSLADIDYYKNHKITEPGLSVVLYVYSKDPDRAINNYLENRKKGYSVEFSDTVFDKDKGASILEKAIKEGHIEIVEKVLQLKKINPYRRRGEGKGNWFEIIPADRPDILAIVNKWAEEWKKDVFEYEKRRYKAAKDAGKTRDDLDRTAAVWFTVYELPPEMYKQVQKEAAAAVGYKEMPKTEEVEHIKPKKKKVKDIKAKEAPPPVMSTVTDLFPSKEAYWELDERQQAYADRRLANFKKKENKIKIEEDKSNNESVRIFIPEGLLTPEQLTGGMEVEGSLARLMTLKMDVNTDGDAYYRDQDGHDIPNKEYEKRIKDVGKRVYKLRDAEGKIIEEKHFKDIDKNSKSFQKVLTPFERMLAGRIIVASKCKIYGKGGYGTAYEPYDKPAHPKPLTGIAVTRAGPQFEMDYLEYRHFIIDKTKGPSTDKEKGDWVFSKRYLNREKGFPSHEEAMKNLAGENENEKYIVLNDNLILNVEAYKNAMKEAIELELRAASEIAEKGLGKIHHKATFAGVGFFAKLPNGPHLGDHLSQIITEAWKEVLDEKSFPNIASVEFPIFGTSTEAAFKRTFGDMDKEYTTKSGIKVKAGAETDVFDPEHAEGRVVSFNTAGDAFTSPGNEGIDGLRDADARSVDAQFCICTDGGISCSIANPNLLKTKNVLQVKLGKDSPSLKEEEEVGEEQEEEVAPNEPSAEEKDREEPVIEEVKTSERITLTAPELSRGLLEFINNNILSMGLNEKPIWAKQPANFSPFILQSDFLKNLAKEAGINDIEVRRVKNRGGRIRLRVIFKPIKPDAAAQAKLNEGLTKLGLKPLDTTVSISGMANDSFHITEEGSLFLRDGFQKAIKPPITVGEPTSEWLSFKKFGRKYEIEAEMDSFGLNVESGDYFIDGEDGNYSLHISKEGLEKAKKHAEKQERKAEEDSAIIEQFAAEMDGTIEYFPGVPRGSSTLWSGWSVSIPPGKEREAIAADLSKKYNMGLRTGLFEIRQAIWSADPKRTDPKDQISQWMSQDAVAEYMRYFREALEVKGLPDTLIEVEHNPEPHGHHEAARIIISSKAVEALSAGKPFETPTFAKIRSSYLSHIYDSKFRNKLLLDSNSAAANKFILNSYLDEKNPKAWVDTKENERIVYRAEFESKDEADDFLAKIEKGIGKPPIEELGTKLKLIPPDKDSNGAYIVEVDSEVITNPNVSKAIREKADQESRSMRTSRSLKGQKPHTDKAVAVISKDLEQEILEQAKMLDELLGPPKQEWMVVEDDQTKVVKLKAKSQEIDKASALSERILRKLPKELHADVEQATPYSELKEGQEGPDSVYIGPRALKYLLMLAEVRNDVLNTPLERLTEAGGFQRVITALAALPSPEHEETVLTYIQALQSKNEQWLINFYHSPYFKLLENRLDPNSPVLLELSKYKDKPVEEEEGKGHEDIIEEEEEGEEEEEEREEEEKEKEKKREKEGEKVKDEEIDTELEIETSDQLSRDLQKVTGNIIRLSDTYGRTIDNMKEQIVNLHAKYDDLFRNRVALEISNDKIDEIKKSIDEMEEIVKKLSAPGVSADEANKLQEQFQAEYQKIDIFYRTCQPIIERIHHVQTKLRNKIPIGKDGASLYDNEKLLEGIDLAKKDAQLKYDKIKRIEPITKLLKPHLDFINACSFETDEEGNLHIFYGKGSRKREISLKEYRAEVYKFLSNYEVYALKSQIEGAEMIRMEQMKEGVKLRCPCTSHEDYLKRSAEGLKNLTDGVGSWKSLFASDEKLYKYGEARSGIEVKENDPETGTVVIEVTQEDLKTKQQIRRSIQEKEVTKDGKQVKEKEIVVEAKNPGERTIYVMLETNRPFKPMTLDPCNPKLALKILEASRLTGWGATGIKIDTKTLEKMDNDQKAYYDFLIKSSDIEIKNAVNKAKKEDPSRPLGQPFKIEDEKRKLSKPG